MALASSCARGLLHPPTLCLSNGKLHLKSSDTIAILVLIVLSLRIFVEHSAFQKSSTMSLDLIIFALLLTSLVFTIIQLGLSAYIVSLTANRFYSVSTYDYLLFCSIWSFLVTGFLIIWAYLARSKSPIAKNGSEKWLSPMTLTLNFVTMVFWLAAFASLADMYHGYNPQNTLGAQLAFAVMLW